jgi:hypothetical protein
LGNVKAGTGVRVDLGYAANVRLMDQSNYASYCADRDHQAAGGYYTQSPVVLGVPRSGHWHVAVDLGGNAGEVKAAVTVLAAG